MQEIMKRPNYQSIKALIQLPKLLPLLPDQHIYSEFREDKISTDIKDNVNKLIASLNKQFKIYENPKTFAFKFFQSSFPSPPKNTKISINYRQRDIAETQIMDRQSLNQDQITSISINGEFKVSSNLSFVKIPYVWKINECLFWGKEKILSSWKNSLLTIYKLFYDSGRLVEQTVTQELKQMIRLPLKYFYLLFGKKQLEVALYVDYKKQIYSDFWTYVLSNYYCQSKQWGSALWNYLYVDYNDSVEPSIYKAKDRNNKQIKQTAQLVLKFKQAKIDTEQKIQTILSVHEQFDREWSKVKKQLIKQIKENIKDRQPKTIEVNNSVDQIILPKQRADESEELLQKLDEKKYTLYRTHILEGLGRKQTPSDVKIAILFILDIFRYIDVKEHRRQRELIKLRKLFEENIKKDNQIRSLETRFLQRALAEQEQKDNQKYHEQYLTDIKNSDMFKSLHVSQQKAYDYYLNLISNFQNLMKQKAKQKPILYKPIVMAVYNYDKLYPYEAQKIGNIYSLKKISEDITISFDSYFWKIKLFFVRLKVWTINFAVFFISVAFRGQFGLRCLFGVDDFAYDMIINSSNGVINYSYRKTVIGAFKQVLEGISNSRQSFQNQPDRGIFGKKFSRICNLIECYIFRFIFVGVIIILIGYSMAIIFISVITFILAITCWIWVFFALLSFTFFNIFIYEYDIAKQYESCGIRMFPVIYYLVRFIASIIMIFAAIIWTVLIVPIVSVFIFIFTVTRIVTRKITDSIMLCLLRCCARVPSYDTAIATKISGPGISKQYYLSILEEDVYILVQSQIEQIVLSKYDRLIYQQIRKNFNTSYDMVKSVLSAFSSKESNFNSNIIYQNTQQLSKNFRQQYQLFCNRYPQNPTNVRFTSEQIGIYFKNSVLIVKSFVEKLKLQKWIFYQYSIQEQNYQQLTKIIWIRIFNCGERIFESLQNLDQRIKLEDQYSSSQGLNMRREVGYVMKAIRGEVKLSDKKEKVELFKKITPMKEIQFEGITKIIKLHKLNSISNVNLDLKDLRSLFIPNLNIKEIVSINNKKREILIQNTKDLQEQ